ncbi:MAG: hypothetical protein UV33_C0048G0003 [Candidatus Daviesbacteria bacterium GW2011_GWA1_42_6]|uniref:Glycosyltransferase RgtA/B/C/D-like domain-containing protein n=1 Tax=Candidatus Daviesbacteria bacterium GW2011_GWA1_42_6 TaxID=1618420 RepID=A0A0G1ARX4_9BACT|nr:MAG: hypothetical protein UV33_C0048G0003 [Candidatus Daviesbacteria bacterium GW2011_GWA1_42_6]
MKNFIFRLAPYIILAGVAFLSYHQLLEMYFWRDDYTGLYFSQKSLVGEPAFMYPYQIAFLVERFFWQFFGLEAARYFLVEIVLYVSATCLLFYFLQKLFRDKKVAFFSTLVFAAGYIGQDAMKMSMGDGLVNVLLLNLVVFIQYLQTKKRGLFILSLVIFFLTIEVAPQRTSSSLLIFLLLDWLLSFKEKKKDILTRNLTFVLMFLVQYFIHPSAWILGYRVIPPGHFLGLFANFSPIYFLNFLGTFWNMLFPSHLQLQFNTFIDIYKDPLNFSKFLLAGIPAFLFAFLTLVFLKFIRPSVYNFLYIGKSVAVFTAFSIFWAYLTIGIKIDQTDLVSIFNGGIFLVFLAIWVVIGAAKSKLLSVFNLLAIFGVLVIFFLTIPERVLVSYNRYLLLPSFTVAFLPVIFITKEFYQKGGIQKNFARSLFFAVVSVLVVLRLFTALSTQQEFVQSYSQHAKRFYQQLRGFLPEVNKKKMVYVEGATKELDLSIGDAARVGYLGSEVAVAINLNTRKENILLPQSLEEIPMFLNKNREIGIDDVYTFLYTEQGLFETSNITKELLQGGSKVTTILSTDWEKGISFYPSAKIWTLQPIEVTIPLKISAGVLETEVFWEYNTFGAVHKDRFVKIPFFQDGLWHEYKFIIPAGGEYLKRVYFKDLTNVPEIGTAQFKYYKGG